MVDVLISLCFGFAVMWMQQCWLALRFRAPICNLWRFLHLIARLIGLLGTIHTFTSAPNFFIIYMS